MDKESCEEKLKDGQGEKKEDQSGEEHDIVVDTESCEEELKDKDQSCEEVNNSDESGQGDKNEKWEGDVGEMVRFLLGEVITNVINR